jgi:hypothetical protein
MKGIKKREPRNSSRSFSLSGIKCFSSCKNKNKSTAVAKGGHFKHMRGKLKDER